MGPLQLLLCLLCAGILKSASQHLRIFEVIEDTHRNCSEHGSNQSMDLVTLYDDDDVKFIKSFQICENLCNLHHWIGLRRKEHNTTGHDYPMCPTNRNITKCSEQLNFVCEKGSFVDVQLNWCSARQYCQYHLLGDLATDGDETNRSQVVWKGGNMTDDWVWEDGGCSVFSRVWNDNMSNIDMFAYFTEGDFRIVVINNRRATWEEALEYCDRRHSGLLQIHTAEDQKAVEVWLSGTQYNGTFWVGLRQSRVFGFWIWKDRMVGDSNWENVSHPEMPLSHPCGVIEAPKWKWKDHNCLYLLPFICEERIVWLDNKK